MPVFYGRILRYETRDEYTGSSLIFARGYDDDKNKNIEFSGNIPAYPIQTPVRIEYEECFSNGAYSISQIHMDDSHEEDDSYFVRQAANISEFGPLLLKKLEKKTGEKIITFLRTQTFEEKDFTRQEYIYLLHFYHYMCLEDVCDYIYELKGSYHDAVLLYNKYKYDTLRMIERNPQLLVYEGINYECYSALAERKNIPFYDKEHIAALTYRAMKSYTMLGDTETSFNDLFYEVSRLEKRADKKTVRLYVLAEMCDHKKYVIHKRDGEYYFAFKKYDSLEESICKNIRRINNSGERNRNNYATVEEIENRCQTVYAPEQKQVFDLFDKSGIKIITGGPGTGKTTVLKGIVTKFIMDQSDVRITLCAPTKSAANKMASSTGLPANTIHHLLGLRPGDDSGAIERLDSDVVIIDETSMLDTELMSRILKALKNGVYLILLGDADQLPSVNAGNILSDLIKSGTCEHYELKQIFRQDKNSSLIIENSRKILNGNANLKSGSVFKIEQCSTEKEILTEMQQYLEPVISMGETYKVITPVKKTAYALCTSVLNKQIHSLMFKDEFHSVHGRSFDDASGEMASVVYNYSKYTIGDRIVFEKNNYETGYFNGQEGIIKKIQNHNDRIIMTILNDENEYVSISGQEISDIELGYAITVHKSQGCEYDHVIIILPDKPSSLLQRKLLYVAITRAKKQVILIYKKDALNICVSNYKERERRTGLLWKLRLQVNTNDV